MAIDEHARNRPGTELKLHSDCVGVLGRIMRMYHGVWDDKEVAEDGSAPLWRAVAESVRRLREAGCGLLLWWVPGHTDGATDEHMVQDLCDSVCSGLERSTWPRLHDASSLFVNDVVATLHCPEMGRCTSEVKSWLEADR